VTRSFVADASVAIAWVHPAQATSETEAMLDRLVAGDSLVVPALWPLEVANAFTILRRRRKLTPAEARSAIEIIRSLPAVIDKAPLSTNESPMSSNDLKATTVSE
jgi:predicted nucleic acid-binding protein